MAEILRDVRIAFTGKMASMKRREAWARVREAGGEPVTYVSQRTAMLVVGIEGWPLLPDGDISLKLRRAEELKKAGCSIRIMAEPGFLDALGIRRSDPARPKTFPAQEVCRVMKIDSDTLQRWEHFGLLESGGGFFDFQDLVSIQSIRELIRKGVRPEKISASLRCLETVLPGLERPLAQLRVIAENPGMLLVDLGGRRLTPTGQMLLDFEGRPPNEGAVLPLFLKDRDVNEWFTLGLECEEEGLYPEAADAFRTVLSLESAYSQAYFHLGNVMREMGILWAAEEFYRISTRMEPTDAPAWGCLAAVQEERGNVEEAIANYCRAIEIDPDYADGHFNLALCYEKAGSGLEARRHWFSYLKLEPTGEASHVAKRHLSIRTTP